MTCWWILIGIFLLVGAGFAVSLAAGGARCSKKCAEVEDRELAERQAEHGV